MEPTKEIYLRSLIRKLKCVQEDFSDVDRLSNEFDTDFQKAWRIALSHMRSKQNPGVFQQLLDEIASAERKSEESSESDKHTHIEPRSWQKSRQSN